MKNVFPVFFILLLFLALACGFLYVWGGTPAPRAAAGAQPAPAKGQCMDGQTQYCKVGNCSGLSTCMEGSWGGCRWERICTPGSKVPCLKDNCPYALKECGECGTGYGPCVGGIPP